MGLEPGQLLSHYRILAKLGEGGMGLVYKAEDEKLGRPVALKVLRSDALDDEERRQRFLREARSAAAVTHPYIAAVYEADEADGVTFIAMEFVEGRTLRSVLGMGRLPIREALRIGSEVAEGLARAHEAHVVHRDLKPENVMVRADGHVKILDFGLAKLVEQRDGAVGSQVSQQETATANLTGRGEVLGTAAYMSPEQARGLAVDHRSDVFSLGSTLYEMVTGKSPFRGPTDLDSLTAILREQPVRASQLNAEVPQEFERIVEKCLEKTPDERYQNTHDLVLDLKHLQRETESHSREAALAPSMRAQKPRRRVLLLAFTGVALAGIAVLAWQRPWAPHRVRVKADVPVVPPAQQADVASVAVLPFANMSEDASNEYFSDGVAEELLNSLAQVPGLRVTGRTSSFSFKGKNEDLRVIGQKLNVGAILEGSVRKSGKQVRITAQLVNAADGFHLWSETYDRTLDDIFAVQEDIARSVTAALRTTLVGKEGSEPKGRRGSGNAEAYNAYLQAEYFRKQGTFSKESLEKAVGYYQQALALDPGYALAWAGLSLAQSSRVGMFYLPVDEGSREAREAVERALALDVNLAEAHTALVQIKMFQDWDWTGMDAESKRALALDPGNSDVLVQAAGATMTLGRFEEALPLFRRALEIDPLNVLTWWYLGYTYLSADRLEEAEAAYKKAVELNPQFQWAHNHLGVVYLLQGRPEVALAEMERETQHSLRLQGLGLAYHRLGKRKEADAALRDLIEEFATGAAFQIAEVYAFRGEDDRAFEWLERAYVQRDAGLAWTKISPLLKNLERDSRYAAFLKKMRLPL